MSFDYQNNVSWTKTTMYALPMKNLFFYSKPLADKKAKINGCYLIDLLLYSKIDYNFHKTYLLFLENL